MSGEPFFYGTGVDVPEGVTHLVIGGVTVVEAGIFRGRRDLARVELREGVREIGRGAFRDCRNLGRVDSPSSLRAIGDGAFYECSSLSEMTLPEGLRRIGSFAFCCHSFEQITIPSSVLEIGKLAFAEGAVLSKVTLAGGTVMVGRNAFQSCPRPWNVATPSEMYALYGCPQLPNIATPSEVIVVEDGERGNGRATVATGGTIALHRGQEPIRLILTSPYLASMPSADVTRVNNAIDLIAGAGRTRSRFLGLLLAIHQTMGGRPRGEGPLDLGAGDVEGRIRVREGADRIRSRFLDLLSAHRRAIASVLERAPLWESEGGGVEPGVIGIILSFLGNVKGG